MSGKKASAAKMKEAAKMEEVAKKKEASARKKESARKEASARKEGFLFLLLLPWVLNFCKPTYIDPKKRKCSALTINISSFNNLFLINIIDGSIFPWICHLRQQILSIRKISFVNVVALKRAYWF